MKRRERRDYNRDLYLRTHGRKRGRYGTPQKRTKPTIAEWAEAKKFNRTVDERLRLIEVERERCRRDLKYLYQVAFAGQSRHPITGVVKQQTLGRIHELAMDFIHLDCINEVVTYSPLPELIPDRDRFGNLRETWVYFKTFDQPPIIQHGGEGPISKMFYGDFWQGVVIRFKGNGLTTALLMPRGMLKTTVCGVGESTRRAFKHPADRQVIRSAVDTKAEEFMEGVKYAIEKRVNRLFGYLKPEGREDWSKEQIRFNVPRNGLDPNMTSSGLNSEKVGSHWTRALLDDVVGEKNTGTADMRAKTRKQYMQLQAQRDKDALLHLNGTRWADDDVNGELIKRESDACFMVVTVLDGDESVPAPTFVTPLGYGKPIWDEEWTIHDVIDKRKKMPEDWFWFGQYFNQFTGTENRMFHKRFIRPIPEQWENMTPRELAEALKLHVTMGVDTASGDPQQEKGKRDSTAALVLGRTPDRRYSFVLDGICEKLTEDEIPKAIVRKALKWRDITNLYGGSFKVGVELQRWSYFLGSALRHEQKKMGVYAAFAVESLKTGNRQKPQRIRGLVPPYSDGTIFWFKDLIVESFKENGGTYDFMELLHDEFVNYFPQATIDDILDAHAYAWEIAMPINWAEPAGPPNLNVKKQKGYYSRKEPRQEEVQSVSGGGYEVAADWSLEPPST